ncbi:MAG: hypothetical protein HYX56_03020 [Chloroflexi bacterium]|nr:hypothetical protein [Chloroflexota bacterium]
MRTREILAGALGAVVLQLLLTGFTSLYTGEGGGYGAPVPVGHSCGFCIINFGGGSDTLAWPVFALNTTITAAVFWVLMRVGGHPSLVPLGGVLFLVLAIVMYYTLRAGAPFAGLPVPIVVRDESNVVAPRVGLLALWIDSMVGAALFAVPHVLRRRARAGQTASLRD